MTKMTFYFLKKNYWTGCPPSGLHFGFFPKCKPDAGHLVYMKFIFSDVDSPSMVTQSSN